MARRLKWLVASLAALSLPLAACSGGRTPVPAPSPTRTFPLTITDDDGVSVQLRTAPRRIVTWAPSNTEILFAIGLGPRVVGVSGPFDDYPPAARSITQVGGAGGVTPDIEKVVSLRPDLVLNGFEGGDDWKHRLRGLGIPVFSIYATTLGDALHDIRTVGQVTGAQRQAYALAESMQRRIDAVTRAVSTQRMVSCFFESYYPPLTTIGPNTFIFDILRRAGCAPVSGEAKGDYPQWSVDELVRNSPNVYLAASESASSVQAVQKRPGFGGILAVHEGHVFLVDSDLITRPGPRVVRALQDLARDLHPSAFAA